MEKVKASFRNRWFVASVVLVVSLSTLAGYNIYQNFHYDNLRHFAFAWSPEQQLIAVGETLWINMTTWWDNENFYATVKVNDYDSRGIRGLGIAFDKNQDWKITEEDEGYILDSINGSCYGIVYLGFFIPPVKVYFDLSPWHICVFNNQTGYEFQIKFPKTEIEADQPTLIHLSYGRDPMIRWNGTDVFLGDSVTYWLSFVSFEVVA